LVPNGLNEWWINTKIECGANQILISKLEFSLRDAKSWH
jgi:hypothetical protein